MSVLEGGTVVKNLPFIGAVRVFALPLGRVLAITQAAGMQPAGFSQEELDGVLASRSTTDLILAATRPRLSRLAVERLPAHLRSRILGLVLADVQRELGL